MLLVDRRVGSKDLLPLFRKAGLTAELVELEFADVAFTGLGAKGVSVDIGVELKTLNDLVGSLRSGRLAGHQLPGLRAKYEHAWLVIEGQWRTDDHGFIVTYQGRDRGWRVLPGKMRASEFEKQVLTLELCGGLHVRYTNSRADTVRFVSNLYRWWSDTPIDKHTSHLAVHEPPTLVPLSDFRKVVCQFPGVGVAFSKAVEVWFGGSLQRAVLADAEEWANVTLFDGDGKSKRFGPKKAETLVEFLHA